MPIPALSPDGLLPDGIHECTVDEVVERFGKFQESDRRPGLARQLTAYIGEVRAAGVAKYLIVDGSFVTGEPRPNDIDLVLVLRDDVQLGATVPPFQYNPRSKKYVRTRYGFDLFFGFDGDASSVEPIAFLRQVKHRPGLVKGLLKVPL